MKFTPTCFMVLIKVDIPDIIAQHGTILTLPEEIEEKHRLGQKTGRVVALGEDAFSPLSGQKESKPTFKIGDHVLFKGYAGVDKLETEDGIKVLYRFMHDTDVVAVIKDWGKKYVRRY